MENFMQQLEEMSSGSTDTLANDGELWKVVVSESGLIDWLKN